MRIHDLSFKKRFLLLATIFLVGYAALIWVAGSTLVKVMIKGELYGDIIQRKDLLADSAPPPLMILEPYLLAHQIVNAADEGTRADFARQYEKARDGYLVAHESWAKRLKDPVVRQKFLVEAHDPVVEFFAIVDGDGGLRNAVAAGDTERATRKLGELDKKYFIHRGAAELGLARVKLLVAQSEADATSEVETGRMRVLLGTLAFVLLMAVAHMWIVRSILGSISHITERMEGMARADADLSSRLGITSQDEVGRLAHWIDLFVEKIGSLVRAVKKSTILLRSTATEMAATSHEQEATVSSFGASTTQIAAAVKEISATGAELAQTMAEVGGVARDSAAIANEGRTSIADMQASMGQLATSSGSISSKLAAINEKARDITGVVTTITKVADQTNLLSVNAAIEAEKAGEYGRGFLVVAREIRRLADQTASATLDIDHTVQQMQGAVSAGVMEMDKFAAQVRRSVEEVEVIGSKLAQIIERVEVLTERFGSVSEGMSSQSVGVRQINDAMSSLTDNVKTTGRSLSEFTSAAEEMKSAVDGIKGELGKFKLEE